MRINRRQLAKLTGAAAISGVAAKQTFRSSAAAQDEVTLTVWDNWTRDVPSGVVEQLNQEFVDSHPGVTIEREVKSFDDLKATARLALGSDDGPDVAQINQGRSDMGAMVEAGVLTDLTPYLTSLGWDQILSPNLIARHSFSADGKTFGEGNLYGMPLTAEFVGIFYNKEKFEAAGVEVPATFGDLEAALQTFKDAGEIPIAFGNLDGWPAIHTYSEIQNLEVDTAYLDDFIYARGGATFNIPASVNAAAKFQEWNEAEFFTPDYSGIGYDDSWAAFRDGQGAMMITGSWISGDLAAAEDGKTRFGFFPTPPLTAGTDKPSVAGTSMAYAIRNGSANTELAAEYINWMASDRATELWVTAQVVPLRVQPEQIEAGTVAEDVVKAWVYLNEKNQIGHYLDWATPTFYDTMVAALAELLGAGLEPQAFVDQMEADYAAYVEELQGAS